MSLVLATRGLARKFSVAETPEAATPTMRWQLDESSGSTADDAQNVQDGTYNNGVELGILSMVSGDAGTAIGLKDGASLRIPHNDAFEAAAWTIVCYAMASVLPAVGGRMGIFSKVAVGAAEFMLGFVNTAGQLRIQGYTCTPTGVASWVVDQAGVGNLTVGQTYRVAIVQRSTGASIQIDAMEFGPNAVTTGIASNQGPLVFGGYLHTTQGLLLPLNGCIDDPRFYAQALSAQEIEALPAAQDTLHLADWGENIDEGTGSIDPTDHAHPESGWTVGTVTDDSLASPPTVDLTADGALADYETVEVEENTDASVTIQITKGLLSSTATVALTVVDAGSGGGSGQALTAPSLAEWLTNDDTADPVGATVVTTASGLTAALAAADPGDTIVINPASSPAFFDLPSGLSFPNGSAGNLVTIMARMGKAVVISAGEDFAGARTTSNGFWTQSGLSQADKDKHIWRSVGTFSGGDQRMMGVWIEFGHPHQVVPALSMTNLRAPYNTADSFDGYAGPCAHKDTDGRLYIRFQQPHPGKYSFNNKRSANMWDGFPEAISGGKAVYPVSQDPNDYVIYLYRCSGQVHAFTGTQYFKVGNGINSLGYASMLAGNQHIQMCRGLHYTWRSGVKASTASDVRRDIFFNRMRCSDGSKSHLSRSEWKFGGPLEGGFRDFWFSQFGAGSASDIYCKDCTIGDYHEILVGQALADKFRWRNCTFVNILDDGIQLPNSMSRFEVGYCYFLNSAWGGFGRGGDDGGPPTTPGNFFLHHNVIDHRQERATHWGAEPHPNFIYGQHSPDPGNPLKIYNNLCIFGPDFEQETGLGFAHADANGDGGNNTDSTMHETFNNIILRVFFEGTKRYNPLAGATYSDGSGTDQSAFVMGRLIRYSAAASNELFDYNLYWRPAAMTGDFLFGYRRGGGQTARNFASLSAWKAHAEFAHSKLSGSQRGAYAPGFDGNSTDAKPAIPTIDDYPTSRFNYRPSATAAVTVAKTGSLSGENWWSGDGPAWGRDYFDWDGLEPDSFKGPLDPNGSTLNVGVTNP